MRWSSRACARSTGFTPLPATQVPDAEEDKGAYLLWRDAGVPVFQFTIQGSSHFEWSLIPSFPSSSWCADTSAERCDGGWGRPMAAHYTLAWFDRWLKGVPNGVDTEPRVTMELKFSHRLEHFDTWPSPRPAG